MDGLEPSAFFALNENGLPLPTSPCLLISTTFTKSVFQRKFVEKLPDVLESIFGAFWHLWFVSICLTSNTLINPFVQLWIHPQVSFAIKVFLICFHDLSAK